MDTKPKVLLVTYDSSSSSELETSMMIAHNSLEKEQAKEGISNKHIRLIDLNMSFFVIFLKTQSIKHLGESEELNVENKNIAETVSYCLGIGLEKIIEVNINNINFFRRQ